MADGVCPNFFLLHWGLYAHVELKVETESSSLTPETVVAPPKKLHHKVYLVGILEISLGLCNWRYSHNTPVTPALTPGAPSCSVRLGGLSLCDVLQWSIQISWEPCFWMPPRVYAHRLFSVHNNTKQKADLEPLSMWADSCLASFIWFSFSSAWCILLVLTVGIQTHRFIINALLSGGWLVVAIETRSSDVSKWVWDVILTAKLLFFSLLLNYEYSPLEISGVINLAGRYTLCCCWSVTWGLTAALAVITELSCCFLIITKQTWAPFQRLGNLI